MKKTVVLLLAILLVALTGCSVRTQARFGKQISLPPLPGDIVYVDGKPKIISISTESDGDVMLAYENSLGQVKIQLYGCPWYADAKGGCLNLSAQGFYVFGG